MGRLVSIVEGCVNVLWSVGFCSCMMCADCVLSHVNILRSRVYPSMLHLSVFDRPRAVVFLGWNPMRSSLMEAFGSRRVSLK